MRRPRPKPRPGAHATEPSAHRQRGAVTVEYAVLFPLLLVLLLAGVQTALWWHARNIALAAAQAGVNAGRPPDADPATAASAATSFADRAGGGVTDIAVTTAGTTAATVRVQVSLTAPRILPLPGLKLRVTQTAEGGRERFTTPGSPP
jgi:Flp pilus assembly protein TadG